SRLNDHPVDAAAAATDAGATRSAAGGAPAHHGPAERYATADPRPARDDMDRGFGRPQRYAQLLRLRHHPGHPEPRDRHPIVRLQQGLVECHASISLRATNTET